MDDSHRRAASAYRKTQGLLKQTKKTDPGKGSESTSDGSATGRAAPGATTDGGVSGRSTQGRPAAGVGAPGTPPPVPPRGAVSIGRTLPASALHEEAVEDVARYLALIGRTEAAGILRKLPRKQTEQILDTMAHLPPISRRDAIRVLGRFEVGMRGNGGDTGTFEGVRFGEVRCGPDAAREILIRAFGEDEGDRRFYEILPDERPSRFAFLADAEGHQLSTLLKAEHPATVATICANMPRPSAARLLEAIDSEKKAAVLRRMATIDRAAPEALQAIETTLRRKLESIERPETNEIDGEARLADILRYMDLSTSDKILNDLKERDPDVEEHIRNRLSVPEDLLFVSDREVQRLLQRVDDVDLATIVKGKGTEFIEKILKNVSERRREMIEMHRESLGPMRRKDVDRVTADFMELIRELALNGEIVIRLPGEKNEWVE